MPRKFRIAVSVIFSLLAVALCVLWARSYWRLDRLRTSGGHQYELHSNFGWLYFESSYGIQPKFEHTLSSERAIPVDARS